MEIDFKEIDINTLTENVFELIGDEWMLITAGTIDSFNTMTASWGGLGVLWNKRICFCFIRPSRYTYKFMEKSDFFSLSFFNEEYRDVLQFCGSNSGRDVDKVAMTGITPLEGSTGVVYFAEAKLVFECKKIYYQDLDPTHFIDLDIMEHYPDKSFHRIYMGEIIKCLIT